MPRSIAAYLGDIREAAQAIGADTAKLSFEGYVANRTIRRATERNFQIIGESLRHIREQRPDLFDRIDDGPQIIGFRHILVHAYFDLDQPTVWDAIQTGLPRLVEQIDMLFDAPV